MGREILFRGKQIDDGKWIEGDYQKRYDSFEDIQHLIFYSKSSTVWGYIEVDPETVCEYTGQTDKNGRKIFDGDILSAHLDDSHPDDITYVQVTWNGFSWCMRESTEDDVMTEWDCNIFEVCGNIFDNPELLN